jgi:hypothetical protein
MPYVTTQPTTPYASTNVGVIQPEVYGIAINWFVNRTPLFSRLPKLPVGSMSFLCTNDNYRPRSVLMNNSGTINSSATSLVVDDGSGIVAGDVIEIESEQMLVTAVSTNTLTIVRGHAGTTAASHVDSQAVYLIGNTRTGAEVDVNGISRTPAPVTQYLQTVQHPYSVGGALQSATNYVSGFNSPLDRDRMLAMQHAVDDFESSMCYGSGVALAGATTRPMQKGLRTLISTNKTTSPTNAGAYKPSDFIRDGIQKAFDGGGRPTLAIVSTDFLTGLSVWGNAVQRVDAGTNIFGTAIEMFMSPFVPGVALIPAPLLRAGTAVVLSGDEVRVRIKRPLVDKPRGSRGDAFEGDMIMEGAIELDNEAHHAWVSGITAYAPA